MTNRVESVSVKPVIASVPILILSALLTVMAAYNTTLRALGEHWGGNASHGFALLALVIWVCWRDRTKLMALADNWWPALLVVLAGNLVWLAGTTAGIQVVEYVALLIVLVGWALGILGRSQERRVLLLGSYLLLALPVFDWLVGVLQWATVVANRVLLVLFRVNATIEGTFIAIPEGTFEVAAGCSGIAFFMSGLTVGVVYGEIVPLTNRGRWLALGLVAGLSLVSNWVRVFLLILIGHFTNMQSPLIADHGWCGWVWFSLSVAAFLFLSRIIEARHVIPETRTVPGSSALSSHLAPAQARSLFAFSGVAVLGPLTYLLLQQIPRSPSPDVIDGVGAAPGWQLLSSVEREPRMHGDTILVRTPWEPSYTGAQRHQTQLWSDAGDTIQVDRLIFSGRNRKERLFAYGNTIANSRSVLVDRAVGVSEGGAVRSLRQAIVRTDSSTYRAVLYWFQVGNHRTGVPLVGRLMQIPVSLMRGAPSELIAASISCASPCERESKSLEQFVRANR